MKKKIIITISIVVIVLCFLILLLIYTFNNPFLSIEIIGDEEKIIEVNTEYIEDGYIAKINNKDLNKKVKVDGNLDVSNLGEYQITYTISYLKTTRSIIRKVNVVDTTAPELTIIGDEKISINEHDQYNEPGYQALDNYDGDLTDSVEIDSNLDTSTPGEYYINYTVTDTSNNVTTKSRKIIVNEIIKKASSNDYIDIVMGPVYINGILIVNKKYALPSDFGNGADSTALEALRQLQNAASLAGFNIPLLSGYRSYSKQQTLYNNYYSQDGALADTYSARPGHSDHQTGLAFDVGSIDDNYGDTAAGMWLNNNCAQYGFIIRFPKGKEDITGYKYEPWHIRYVGVEAAMEIMSRNISLEEYLGV